MNQITYFPVVENEYDLNDILSRAAWFLTPFDIDKICIPVNKESLTVHSWSVAPEMDLTIAKNFELLRKKVKFIIAHSVTDLDRCMSETSILLRWKEGSKPDFVSTETLSKWERGKKVWRVDPLAIRMEGSFYIELGMYLLKNQQSLIQENQLKFARLISKLGKFKRAYLMATGPSISRYKLFDYSEAISIICNSVILDEELMEIVQPQILVFADPIFHFGPSQYAATFREKLKNSAIKHDFTICIPFKYYALFVATIPELRDRTIAIPFIKDREFNFDLASEFILKSTANILTFLMVPLACTFTDEVGFLGCDGRPLKENTYFWNHNPNTQINDKMENIRKVHPGFFAIDYNDYYLEHCNTLEAQLQEGEKIGKRFLSLGFSHIPALNCRIGVGRRRREKLFFDSVQQVFIIDPDAKSWFGHYMAYNEKLSAEFIKHHGLDVRVICRKDLDPNILSSRSNYIPTLSVHSWEVGNRPNNHKTLERFEAELFNVLNKYYCREKAQLLYMYCGSLEHASVIAKVQERFSSLRVNINLFYLSFKTNQVWAQDWKFFLEWLDTQNDNFVATLPTIELQNEVAELSGCILPVAPHPSTGITDEKYYELALTNLTTTNEQDFQILFPSAPRFEKGYLLSLECVRLLGKVPNFHLVVRHSPTFSTPKELTKPLEAMPSNAIILKGELSDDEFIEMFSQSDIVVLPYTPEAFAKRTSGLLIDALYHRIPCVVIDGTWLASTVRHYGCGLVVENESAELIVEAIKAIASEYYYYRKQADIAATDYFSRSSWDKFGKFLLGLYDETDYVFFPSRLKQFAPAPAKTEPIPTPQLKLYPSIHLSAPQKRLDNVTNPDFLIVIGNGPSLRGLNLSNLNSYAALGMNAAYRYWDRVGWYPTYYMCLDTIVTESHEKEIERLIRDSADNGIQLFLVRKTLVKRFPHLGHDPKVIVFDDYMESKYFSGINLTTGSFAPLFGAMLGYRNVYLLGIDLNYIQQIPEAKQINSHVLEIAQTPHHNPNYFFDDYQRKGDRYNIPDSLPDLHYQSWVHVKYRLDELGVDVLNGNPQSRIASLFDLMTIDAFLGSKSVQGND